MIVWYRLIFTDVIRDRQKTLISTNYPRLALKINVLLQTM